MAIKTISSSSDKPETSKKGESPAGLLASIGEFRQFLQAVIIEFRKISWPERAQVLQETYSVLFLVAVITLMVLAFDWLVGKFIFAPLADWTRTLGRM